MIVYAFNELEVLTVETEPTHLGSTQVGYVVKYYMGFNSGSTLVLRAAVMTKEQADNWLGTWSYQG